MYCGSSWWTLLRLTARKRLLRASPLSSMFQCLQTLSWSTLYLNEPINMGIRRANSIPLKILPLRLLGHYLIRYWVSVIACTVFYPVWGPMVASGLGGTLMIYPVIHLNCTKNPLSHDTCISIYDVFLTRLRYWMVCTSALPAGLPWGWHSNPHTHPIPIGIPIGIPMGIPIPTEPEVHVTCRPTIPHRKILAVF